MIHDMLERQLTPQQLRELSTLALAHVGDGVYELLVRSYLCMKGDQTVKTLHKDAVNLVKAASQAKFVEQILPFFTEEEFAYYRRGKNTHTHAAPRAATPKEYAMATGLETLFGALYLYGRTERLSELFEKGMESYGI